ncbi:hypothetical protein F5Y16DRAFT_400983 [Xylariaceae sp. FL0255]|nr:hypothetical protein F5Y16DRAFT_400983 [Xylariaceae sp. FL0255]
MTLESMPLPHDEDQFFFVWDDPQCIDYFTSQELSPFPPFSSILPPFQFQDSSLAETLESVDTFEINGYMSTLQVPEMAGSALPDQYAEHMLSIFGTPMALDFGEVAGDLPITIDKNDAVIAATPTPLRDSQCIPDVQPDCSNSVYAEDFSPHAPPSEMELALWGAKGASPLSDSDYNKLFELYCESESLVSTNQLSDYSTMSNRSPSVGATADDMSSLKDDPSSPSPSPQMNIEELQHDSLPATQEELCELAPEAIPEHSATSFQSDTLSNPCNTAEVDDKAAESLFAMCLMCHVLLASSGSHPMKLGQQPGEAVNSLPDSEYSITPKDMECQSDNKDAPYDIDDSKDRLPVLSETDTPQSRKRKNSCDQSRSGFKRIKHESPKELRHHKFASTRFECAIYHQERTYKWERRREELWPEKSEELLDLLKKDPAGLLIKVRPEAGDKVWMKWSEKRQKFVNHDTAGKRVYRVSVEKIKRLVENPRTHVEFKYIQY